MRADLHTHSTYSDGSDSPRDLLRKAADIGVSVLALTDHDTQAGITEAQEAAQEFDIVLIPEWSCLWRVAPPAGCICWFSG